MSNVVILPHEFVCEVVAPQPLDIRHGRRFTLCLRRQGPHRPFKLRLHAFERGKSIGRECETSSRVALYDPSPDFVWVVLSMESVVISRKPSSQ